MTTTHAKRHADIVRDQTLKALTNKADGTWGPMETPPSKIQDHNLSGIVKKVKAREGFGKRDKKAHDKE